MILRTTSLLLVTSSALVCLADSPSSPVGPSSKICSRIAHSISSASAVYYPGDPLYEKGIVHWSTSSTQRSKCVVEAGTPSDVGKILVILGETRTPFAVKSGGHAFNPGFSSTPDVHISMYRFSEVKYNASSQTAEVGTGQIWDDVYTALEPFGVNVLGGRVTGIGVGGFLLGGGYSWKTNQYGLAIDTIVAYELVKPNGRVVKVTQNSDPELFFGLKGGMNNFGIVTKFTMKAFPQTQVWGGSLLNAGSDLPAMEAAAVAFQSSVTDPKVGLIMSYSYVPQVQQVFISSLLFYDAPTPPPGIFDAFLAVPAITSDISTRSFTSLVQSSPANGTFNNARGTSQGVPIAALTPSVSQTILNETNFWGQALANKTGVGLSYSMEIFLPSIYTKSSVQTAYPPTRDVFFQPFDITYSWNSSQFDADFQFAVAASGAQIRNAAIADGQTDLVRASNYPNYAVAGTPLADMYGANVPRLQALKRRVDPNNVMGLSGGWRF